MDGFLDSDTDEISVCDSDYLPGLEDDVPEWSLNPEALPEGVLADISRLMNDTTLKDSGSDVKDSQSQTMQGSQSQVAEAQSPETEPMAPGPVAMDIPEEGMSCSGCLAPWCQKCVKLSENEPVLAPIDGIPQMRLTLTDRNDSQQVSKLAIEKWKIEADLSLDPSICGAPKPATPEPPKTLSRLEMLPLYDVNEFKRKMAASFREAGLSPLIWEQFIGNHTGLQPADWNLSSEEERWRDEQALELKRIKDDPSLLTAPWCLNWKYPTEFEPLPYWQSHMVEWDRKLRPPPEFFSFLGISLKEPDWFYQQVRPPLEQDDLLPEYRQGTDNDVFRAPDCRPLPDPRGPWQKLLDGLPGVKRVLDKEEGIKSLLACECPLCVRGAALAFARNGLALICLIDTKIGSIEYLEQKFFSLVLTQEQQNQLAPERAEEWIIFATTAAGIPSIDSILVADFRHLREVRHDRYFLRPKSDPGLRGLKAGSKRKKQTSKKI